MESSFPAFYLITPRSLLSRKLDQKRNVFAFQLLDFFEGLRGVHFCGKQQAEGLLQQLQALRREAAALKADFVDAEGLVFALGRR